MSPTVAVTTSALVAAVLLLAALGKLHDPARAAAAATALRVPSTLRRPWLLSLHPWVELALALLLILASGWAKVAALGAAVLLLAGYLVLIARAWRAPEDVDCDCFGALGSSRVTGLTVARNAWLLGLGVTAFAAGLGVTRSVVDLLATYGGYGWAAGLVAAMVTTWLVVGPGGDAGDTAAPAQVAAMAVEEGDYVRSRIPAIPVTLADGTRTQLRALSSQRAQLLVYVADWCASCHEVVEAVPRWREQLGPLDVRLVLRNEPEGTSLTSTAEPQSLHDTEGFLNESFGMRSTPSAILLGADGLLAGGPVVGADAVIEFVDEIAVELGASA